MYDWSLLVGFDLCWGRGKECKLPSVPHSAFARIISRVNNTHSCLPFEILVFFIQHLLLHS